MNDLFFISVISLTPQTTRNGSEDFHRKANKVKLWNSLELSNTLTIDNVTVDHTGEYTCTASSGRMEKSASAFLKVYGKTRAHAQTSRTLRVLETHTLRKDLNPLLNAVKPKVDGFVCL